MIRGTKQLSRQEIARCARQAAGRRYTPRATAGKAVVHASKPSATICRQCSNLLRQVLREPALPEDEFEVLRREALAELEQQLTDPQTLAHPPAAARTVSPYDKDDVRYDPTVEEDIERVNAADARAGEAALQRLSRRAAGEWRSSAISTPKRCLRLCKKSSPTGGDQAVRPAAEEELSAK